MEMVGSGEVERGPSEGAFLKYGNCTHLCLFSREASWDRDQPSFIAALKSTLFVAALFFWCPGQSVWVSEAVW